MVRNAFEQLFNILELCDNDLLKSVLELILDALRVIIRIATLEN